jgi:hypothetical protein
MQSHRLRIICTLFAVLGYCSAGQADIVSRVDLRNNYSDSTDFYVVICARESEPWGTGHTFVVWIQQDNRTGKVQSQGHGFYPEIERVVVRLFTGDGIVQNESTKASSVKPWLLTHRLIVQVDRETFKASLHAKDQWIGSGIDYHLFDRNCTHFAHDIMQAIQLGAPEPEYLERPGTYVGRLMTLNLGRCPANSERLSATFVTDRD